MGILRKKRTAQHRYVPNCTWNDVPPTVAIQALSAQRPLAGRIWALYSRSARLSWTAQQRPSLFQARSIFAGVRRTTPPAGNLQMLRK